MEQVPEQSTQGKTGQCMTADVTDVCQPLELGHVYAAVLGLWPASIISVRLLSCWCIRKASKTLTSLVHGNGEILWSWEAGLSPTNQNLEVDFTDGHEQGCRTTERTLSPTYLWVRSPYPTWSSSKYQSRPFLNLSLYYRVGFLSFLAIGIFMPLVFPR